MVKRIKKNIKRNYKKSLKGGAGHFWEDYKKAHRKLEKQGDLLYNARDQYDIILRNLLIRKYPKQYKFIINIRANSLANKEIIEFNKSRLKYNKEALGEHHAEEDELKGYLIDGKLKRMSHKEAANKQLTWMIGKAADTIRSPKKIFNCLKSLFWHFAHAVFIKMFMTAITGGFNDTMISDINIGPWITWGAGGATAAALAGTTIMTLRNNSDTEEII